MRVTPFASTLGACAIVFGTLARPYVQHYRLSAAATFGIYFCFLTLLALALAPGCLTRGKGSGNQRPRLLHVFLLGSLCVLPYLFYAAGTGDFEWLAFGKLAVLAISTLGAYALVPVRHVDKLCWQDGCVAVVLIAAVLTGWLKNIWSMPLNLDFMARLFLIAVAASAWSWIRPLPGLGYSLRITVPISKEAGLQFAAFAAIAIPLSLALHFTRWHSRWSGFRPFAASYLEIFLFVALLEELFFRGFLQVLLTGTLRSWLAAQLLVSVLFGLFHIFHAPFPNWRYVTLATIAGWFYGSAFRKTGNITTSALVHAAVDTVWRTWLSA